MQPETKVAGDATDEVRTKSTAAIQMFLSGIGDTPDEETRAQIMDIGFKALVAMVIDFSPDPVMVGAEICFVVAEAITAAKAHRRHAN